VRHAGIIVKERNHTCYIQQHQQHEKKERKILTKREELAQLQAALNAQLVSINTRVPRSTWDRFKRAAHDDGYKIQDAIERALTEYLARRDNGLF
jgi:predicted DNA binding CopG/RHH family protein